MKIFKIQKSSLLLAFLLLITGLIKLTFGSGTALTLMSFFTFITTLYVILKYLNQKHKNKKLRILRIIFRWSLLVMGVLTTLILTLVTIPQLSCEEVRSKADKAEYVILLGAGLRNGDQASYTIKMRLDKALEVFHQNKTLKIIVSGGQGSDEKLSEAQFMKNYLVKNGVPANQIILEDQSRSTYENLLFSKEKLKNEKKIIIVSSNYHIFRANFIARNLDLKPVGICSPAYFSLRATSMIREIPAVVNDFFKATF